MPGAWLLSSVAAPRPPGPLWPRVQELLEAPQPPFAAGAPARLWSSSRLAAAPPWGLQGLAQEVVLVLEAAAPTSLLRVQAAALQLVQVLAVLVLALQLEMMVVVLVLKLLPPRVLASPPRWVRPGRAPFSLSSS